MTVAAVRRMDIREYDAEPVRGLPERLPKGEEILWQGTCGVAGMARRAFHVRKVAAYFIVLLVWYAASAVHDGTDPLAVAISTARFAAIAAVVPGVLYALAWGISRTTVYTVTNRRLVMRYGMAFPMIVNIPFKIVESADLRPYPDGTGDLVLSLSAAAGTSYIMMWPHVRPWRVASVQPMLRCVPDVEKVAQILARALASFAGTSVQPAPVAGDAQGADPRSHATAAA